MRERADRAGGQQQDLCRARATDAIGVAQLGRKLSAPARQRVLGRGKPQAMNREAQPVATIALDRERDAAAELSGREPAVLRSWKQRECRGGLRAIALVPG